MRHLLQDVRALSYMLDQDQFEQGVTRIGAEQELFLVDDAGQPAPLAMEVLARLNDPRMTTELARFNLEFNLDPLRFEGTCLRRLEGQVDELLNCVREAARALDAEVALVGILPSLRLSDLSLDNLTPRERYHALNERLTQMRGAPYAFHIRGADELLIQHDSVMLEACNTSFQVHLQVHPDAFARFYNAAQVIAAPVLAAAVNAPLLFGKRLWRETRIALFQQAVQTHEGDLYLREPNPRVTFGTDWVRESVLEIFREDIARYRTVINAEIEEDALVMAERGEVPHLRALQVHNSTIYRWNRACYGITDGRPHLRIENRILPAGPSPLDEVANAAFWLGLLHGLTAAYEDVTAHIDFVEARANFVTAARLGLQAQLHWFEGRALPVAELIEQELLPLARAGLEDAGVETSDIDRYLGVVEARVTSRRTGADWLLDCYEQLHAQGAHVTPHNALVTALVRRQQDGAPSHTWAALAEEEMNTDRARPRRVEEIMSTDLFTVQEHELLELATSVMRWRKIRHLPVEDDHQRLVGLVTLSKVLAAFVPGDSSAPPPQTVRDVMVPEPVTISPGASILDAARCMAERKVGCLPVVQEGRLVGILTEQDFMELTVRLIERDGAA